MSRKPDQGHVPREEGVVLAGVGRGKSEHVMDALRLRRHLGESHVRAPGPGCWLRFPGTPREWVWGPEQD